MYYCPSIILSVCVIIFPEIQGTCFLTFKWGQQAFAVAPLQLKDVEADKILKVHQNNHQRVELISQPEVCKLHSVKWRCEHTKLYKRQEKGGGRWKEEMHKQTSD